MLTVAAIQCHFRCHDFIHCRGRMWTLDVVETHKRPSPINASSIPLGTEDEGGVDGRRVVSSSSSSSLRPCRCVPSEDIDLFMAPIHCARMTRILRSVPKLSSTFDDDGDGDDGGSSVFPLPLAFFWFHPRARLTNKPQQPL